MNAEDIVPINSEHITKPVRTHITANTRPARVLAVLSPYLKTAYNLLVYETSIEW